jgi:hypothetical protein
MGTSDMVPLGTLGDDAAIQLPLSGSDGQPVPSAGTKGLSLG